MLSKKHFTRFAALFVIISAISLSACLVAPEPEGAALTASSVDVTAGDGHTYLEQGYRSWLASEPTIDPLPESFLRLLARSQAGDGHTYLEQGYRSWLASEPTIDPLPESFLRLLARSQAGDGQTYPEQLQRYQDWLAGKPTIDPLPESFIWSVRNSPNDN